MASSDSSCRSRTNRCVPLTSGRIVHCERVSVFGLSTRPGDPDPKTGVFGNHDCMGEVRAWRFNAVIGIGGVGQEPHSRGIARKLTWIGIGPQAIDHNGRGPQLVFRHFWYRGEQGPMLETNYPALASRMYDRNVRVLIHSPSSEHHAALDREVKKILRLAEHASASDGPANRGKLADKRSVRPNRVCR